jgi:hypothetical protein
MRFAIPPVYASCPEKSKVLRPALTLGNTPEMPRKCPGKKTSAVLRMEVASQLSLVLVWDLRKGAAAAERFQ